MGRAPAHTEPASSNELSRARTSPGCLAPSTRTEVTCLHSPASASGISGSWSRASRSSRACMQGARLGCSTGRPLRGKLLHLCGKIHVCIGRFTRVCNAGDACFDSVREQPAQQDIDTVEIPNDHRFLSTVRLTNHARMRTSIVVVLSHTMSRYRHFHTSLVMHSCTTDRRPPTAAAAASPATATIHRHHRHRRATRGRSGRRWLRDHASSRYACARGPDSGHQPRAPATPTPDLACSCFTCMATVFRCERDAREGPARPPSRRFDPGASAYRGLFSDEN